jgi:hypothetical protein
VPKAGSKTHDLSHFLPLLPAQELLSREDQESSALEALMMNDVMAVLCCPLVQDPVAGNKWVE